MEVPVREQKRWNVGIGIKFDPTTLYKADTLFQALAAPFSLTPIPRAQ